MSPKATLELEGVTKRFGGAAAVDDVSLATGEGELCVVVGPSGCGKSTLLRVVAGLEVADRGTVRIGGKDVTRLPPRERDVAFVFQSYALYPHLSVRGNLEFPLRLRRASAAERNERVRAAADLLGIAHLLDRRPRELSGGERQRVAIGRAVVRRPRLFLFDEPLSNLDARLRAEMRVELVLLHRRIGVTSVYVTHDQAEAMTLGERIVVMESGRIRQQGTPREIYDHPVDEFVAGFLGSPPMSFLPGEITDGRFRAAALDLPSPPGLAPGPVTLGVRPEDLVPGEGPLEIVVRVVEDLGAERLVHGSVGDASIVLRATDASVRAAPGDRLRVRPAKEHWFRDGRRVSR